MINWSKKAVSGNKENWEGVVKKTKKGTWYAELRKTFQMKREFGQMLVVVGDPLPPPTYPHKATDLLPHGVKISCNGPCAMELADIADLNNAVYEAWRKIHENKREDL